MRPSLAAVLLLLASCLAPGHGILEANYTSLKCKCSKTISRPVHPNIIERIQVTPPGNGCPKFEALIWTRSKQILCVNPQDRWFKMVLKYRRRKALSSTPPAPVSKKRTT
ncbi:C-X-C motif chemokine 13 isoform X2 [Microtus ochrogaster]|uniref:C-X-C motif chemokine 13 isoform X2 n=1 Tax=Microtus ochrogaster TaxID=79684 RepID=A0ABM0L5W1_MICOH|nr:C-X-C motif chemokine 13 isoform X2 [Microtus ochrogaster]